MDSLALALADSAAPPVWTVIPFAIYLLAIALTPLFFAHFWEHNKNKFILAMIASVPVVIFLLAAQHDDPSTQTDEHGFHWLVHSLKEYVAFIVLLASLFVISGGIHLKGSLAGTPIVNTGFMLIGALLASFIGTTGASMLLIRPMLRANEKRQRKMHIVIFFIFIVSNGAGMLTPLGDPPLFLGFLRGVPFLWTLKLFLPWALVNGILLVLFHILDEIVFNKEERERPGSQLEEVQQIKEPLRIQGGLNFLWLLGVIGVIYVIGAYGEHISKSEDVRLIMQVVGMAAMAGLSLAMTGKGVRAANKFGWGPIIEVAVIFIGIFVTMVPALKFLEAKGGAMGITQPWQFFWASGVLSSFLDNAPTYLTFATVGVSYVNSLGNSFDANFLGPLVEHEVGAKIMTAVSCGAVFMGANTYIGNGPNFMVKAIAEENGVKMPSFFGYMLWSIGILFPLFVLVTFIFFKS
ncbi:MAG TPA: sodium:proton antiporter [Planctomycetota bacterium]|nr:sodium:proton antiporter [Planctomycetota bacterium]